MGKTKVKVLSDCSICNKGVVDQSASHHGEDAILCERPCVIAGYTITVQAYQFLSFHKCPPTRTTSSVCTAH